jgi:SRSO17 transposase
MDTDRNLANVGRKTGISGQNLQHFVSNSSWLGEDMILAVENEVKVHPAFQEAILVLDESAEEKAGKHSAGAGRQYNSRLGKIEMSQVGVFLALVTPNVCTWIDGERFIPKDWLEDNFAEQRKKVGLPEGLSYQTKPEIGWELIERTQERQIPFDAVVMDDLYERNQDLRQKLHKAVIEYYGDIPADTKVYLEKPQIVYPLTTRGAASIVPQIVGTTIEVRELRQKDWLEWQPLRLRSSERGYLDAKFARVRVWLVYDNEPRQE